MPETRYLHVVEEKKLYTPEQIEKNTEYITRNMSKFQKSSNCKMCNLIDPDTSESLRFEAEEIFYYTKNWGMVVDFVESFGGLISIESVKRHVRDHASYLINKPPIPIEDKEEVDTETIEADGKVTPVVDVEASLDAIIKRGDLAVLQGKIVVSRDLYIAALKLKVQMVQAGKEAGNLLDAVTNAWLEKNKKNKELKGATDAKG